jgi:uncharacterized protein YecT (DUF1311 family)
MATRKIIEMLVRVLFVVFILSGCGKTGPDTRTIDGLIEHFKQSGLMVTGKSGKSAEMLGASEGAGIEIFGKGVEVYRYDVAKEAQKLTLEKIAKEKSITFFSIVAPAKLNGGFVMIGYDEHPEKEKILKAFESWGLSSSQPSTAQPGQAQGVDLLKEMSGVWKILGETGVFKFKLNDARKYVIINDGSAEETVASVIIASLDQQNKIVNLALEADTKKTFLTLKLEFTTGNSNSFNIKLTLPDGNVSKLEFVRNIDSTDNLPTIPATAVSKAELAPQPSTKIAQSEQESVVEQTGVCKDLDLAVTADQIECLNRKFTSADKQLNETYKQLMATLDDSRKSALKKEQVAWIKEKVSKCNQAGKEFEGGTMETVLVSDCEVEMTEKRIAYLKNFR